MGDDWQLEAVHEQFKAFESLRRPYPESLASTDLNGLIARVRSVVQKHLWIEQGDKTYSERVREITATILTNTNDEEDIKLSFILIVLDKDVNDRLCAIPVFSLKSGNKQMYIDIGRNVYKSWKTFMSCNDLPICNYCFPVDGKYSLEGKLKIAFAKSPAASQRIVSRTLFYGTLAIGCGIVVASFFFKIPKFITNCAREMLIPCAKKFLADFNPDFANTLLSLVELIQRFRNGASIDTVLFQGYRLFSNIIEKYNDKISFIWEDILYVYRSAYAFVKKHLDYWFFSDTTSESDRGEFLALVNSADMELVHVSSKAQNELLQAQEANGQETADNVNVEKRELCTNSGGFSMVDQPISNPQQIFENCRTECLFHMNKKDSDTSLSPRTEEVLKITTNVSTRLDKKNLNDVKDVFMCCSSMIQEKYDCSMEYYSKSLIAAREAAGHDIDLEAFNRSLGIPVGNPENHFWQEAVNDVERGSLFPAVLKVLSEKTKGKKIELIPINNGEDNRGKYLYRCIGIHRGGEISTALLLKAVKDLHVIEFDDDDLVITETSSLKIIRSPGFIALFHHEVDEIQNTATGHLYIDLSS